MMQLKICNQHYEPKEIIMNETFWKKTLTLQFAKTNDFFFTQIKIGSKAEFAGRIWKVKEINIRVFDETDYTEVIFH